MRRPASPVDRLRCVCIAWVLGAGCLAPAAATGPAPAWKAAKVVPANAALVPAIPSSAPPGRPAESTLPAPVAQALLKAGLPPESLALRAFPLDDPSTGFAWQADRPMVPGSVMKLLTAAVALDRLGSEQRPRTELLAEAAAMQGVQGVQGVLDGPLYLRGAGDGELDTPALWDLLRRLRQDGVRTLARGIVLDRSLFAPERPDLSAQAFDDTPFTAYNVVPDALLLDGGVQQLELRSGNTGALQARLPDWPQVAVDTRGVELVQAPCRHWDILPLSLRFVPPSPAEAGSVPRLVLAGRFPVSCEFKPWWQALDREWVLAYSLRQIWQSLDGELLGEIRGGTTPPAARALQTHWGRPLAESLRGALKRSDNVQLRLLYQRVGAEGRDLPAGATSDRAAAATRAWLQRQHLEDPALVLDNGAGLSRSERLSAETLAGVIRAMLKSPQAPDWLSGLPLAGVDGTLRRRFVGSPAQGRARLKTGTLNEVISLAGVVQDGTGRPWVMVLMLNDEAASWAGRPALDEIVNWLAARR